MSTPSEEVDLGEGGEMAEEAVAGPSEQQGEGLYDDSLEIKEQEEATAADEAEVMDVGECVCKCSVSCRHGVLYVVCV